MEYLNVINCGTLPLAKLKLKIGCPVMVLKNLDAANGVCNGSRGILTGHSNRVLEVKLLTGEHAGETVFIPRTNLQRMKMPLGLQGRQFPIRVCFSMTINKSQGQLVKFVGWILGLLLFYTWAILCCSGCLLKSLSQIMCTSSLGMTWLLSSRFLWKFFTRSMMVSWSQSL